MKLIREYLETVNILAQMEEEDFENEDLVLVFNQAAARIAQEIEYEQPELKDKFKELLFIDSITIRIWVAHHILEVMTYDDNIRALALKELCDMKDSLTSNNELTLGLYINVNRHRILDFASRVANDDALVSREEFNRIFKVYNEYEEILQQHNKTNGEVDVAYRIITEAYETHMRNHTFIEDIRGYNK